MKTWREALEPTWLNKPDLVGVFDDWVRARLIEHRGVGDAESVGPWTVRVLVHDIKQLGVDGRWLWATAAIALLSELLFCAKSGGTFAELRKQKRRGDRDEDNDEDALRTLRNAVFHPAHQKADGGSGPPAMMAMHGLLENDDDADVRDVAGRIKVDWSCIALPAVSRYALRKIDSAGLLFAQALDLDASHGGDPHPRRPQRRSRRSRRK